MERSGGEYSAAVAVFHNSRLRVHQCNLQDNQFAFRAVTAKDVVLELTGNTIQGELWYDTTRPGTLVSIHGVVCVFVVGGGAEGWGECFHLFGRSARLAKVLPLLKRALPDWPRCSL